MRRLSRDTVRMRISIALTILKPYQKRVTGIDNDAVRDWLAEELTSRIMGKPDNEAVLVAPSMVTAAGRHSERHGRWGEDEPHPFPDMPFSDH